MQLYTVHTDVGRQDEPTKHLVMPSLIVTPMLLVDGWEASILAVVMFQFLGSSQERDQLRTVTLSVEVIKESCGLCCVQCFLFL
jgi:hypothetical protein